MSCYVVYEHCAYPYAVIVPFVCLIPCNNFQSLAVVTLGDKQMAQRIDNLESDDEVKRFYLQVSLTLLPLNLSFYFQHINLFQNANSYHLHFHIIFQYSFPPSSVGEVGRIGAPSRREIGHGTLAERALEPVLPSDNNFPYTIRVESTITESNGSSRWILFIFLQISLSF